MSNKQNQWNKYQVAYLIFSIMTALFILGVPESRGKSVFDFIGGAFCHQIPERTPQYGFVWFPFCFRCTGLFLGIFFSFLFIKRNEMPKPFAKYALYGLLAALCFFGIDILNSTTLLDIDIYPDRTISRLLSGFSVGYTIVLVVAPLWKVVNQDEIKTTFPAFNNFLWFLISSAISCFLIYKAGVTGRIMVSVCTVGSSLFLLSFLYAIMAKAAAAYKGISIQKKTACLFGISAAIFQIAVLGTAHVLIF